MGLKGWISHASSVAVGDRQTEVEASLCAVTQGFDEHFVAAWLRSCALTWPVAFPTVTLVAPWVRRLVGWLTV